MPENIVQANRRVLKRGTLGLYCHENATKWRETLCLSGVYRTSIAIIITIDVTYYHLKRIENTSSSAIY